MTKKKSHSTKSTGFRVPKGYFNSVIDSVLNRIGTDGYIGLPETNGFKTPDGYLTTIESKVLSQLNTVPQTKVRQFSVQHSLYYISGIAAALVLFFALIPNAMESSDLTLEMVETYFENKDLDSYELAELLIESDLLEIDDLTLEPEYDDQDIEAYLLDNADLEQIIQ